VLILYTGWQRIDPILSLLVAAVILAGTWGVFRESVRLAVHAVPGHVDARAVRDHLQKLDGVREVHDLHIWGMSTTETALTAHLVMPGGHPGDAFLSRVCEEMEHDFDIAHATFQIETGSDIPACKLAPDHVV
jgi:cobalt-zinc-cadmium efflux system protein